MMDFNGDFCPSLTQYKRFLSREVSIGNLKLGANNPIRIQSMTTTDTLDTVKTVAQSIRMIEAGCELLRITAPSIKEAENLKNIKAALNRQGFQTPLVADIHFTPNAAELAARIVEKVRVNPGNYADKKKFEHIDYTDGAYDAELERIRKKFIPLIKICKEYGTAMRIGTNHGSLSDRILSRYGDTPHGMVESAMEFLRICEEENYYNIVLSMKASNAQVMVQAYRLLVKTMMENKMNYPLHLGVTEAGEGEDGRIKSAVGIGTLLEDGLGDTIRVSLTEEPEFEMPVAKALAERYSLRSQHKSIQGLGENWHQFYNPYSYEKRNTQAIHNIGQKHVPVVVGDLGHQSAITPANLFAFGYHYSVNLDKYNLTDMACDYIFIGDADIDFEIPGTLGVIQNYKNWNQNKERHYPLIPFSELSNIKVNSEMCFVQCNLTDVLSTDFKKIQRDHSIVLVIEPETDHIMPELRSVFIALKEMQSTLPVIIKRTNTDELIDSCQLNVAADIGGLLLDGFGDGIWVYSQKNLAKKSINELSFGILQATRTRISKTEYISCPSCGRTLFDLQETTAKIRQRTHHLKGVKIGIMGCIVNGPGEMADADYGYVGTGNGVITLYKGKEVVKKNIPSEQAVDALIDLIKDGGDWVEMYSEENIAKA
jgi:(E)-4-hydroxy-3-methylbut-2-enyl-diphosphate synthase